MQSKRKFLSGFSLIEVLVAIAILFAAILLFSQVFLFGWLVERDNQMKTQAMFLVQQKIEETFSKDYQDIAVGEFLEESLLTPFESFSRQTHITYVDSNLEDSLSETDLKKIYVEVSWPSSLKVFPRRVEIITLMTKK